MPHSTYTLWEFLSVCPPPPNLVFQKSKETSWRYLDKMMEATMFPKIPRMQKNVWETPSIQKETSRGNTMLGSAVMLVRSRNFFVLGGCGVEVWVAEFVRLHCPIDSIPSVTSPCVSYVNHAYLYPTHLLRQLLLRFVLLWTLPLEPEILLVGEVCWIYESFCRSGVVVWIESSLG